ncbi:MAG TPA: toll/interleukin-1 receptor domain-containing protein, partial [Myxococcales bacterium]|nr:toll/interleukin-1 receptor domain-containing protein [Myxococcales bacterium]
MPPVLTQKPPVFISYARNTGAEAARALHAALGNDAFFDQEDIGAEDRFPPRIADALLGSRVVVVFPDEGYFTRPRCRWELQTALGLFARSPVRESLLHLVVVLPPGQKPSEIDWFPPELQSASWQSTADTAAVLDMVQKRLEQNHHTLGHRYAERGEPEAAVRARLLELSEAQRSVSLAGPEDAASIIQEAVEAYRKLAKSSPDALLPDLALSLNNLSIRLGELGRRGEGLRAVEEAVEVHRKLAKAWPDAFWPDLASSLNNLSIRLGDLGRGEAGLAAANEATEVYRKL